jgi:hypothetical protein
VADETLGVVLAAVALDLEVDVDEGVHGELGVSRLALLLVAVVARDLGGAHCVRGDARHALQQVDELVAMV